MKKKLFLFVCLLFALTEICQAQRIKFANTLGGLSSQYGISDTTVFKIDVSGNSVWVKDFSGKLEPLSSFRNTLIDCAYDGKNLYILELQGYPTIGTTYNPAIFKMDTLGNILDVVSSAVQPGGNFYVSDIFPSVVNGAWVVENYSPGIFHHGNVMHLDSTLQTLSNIDFYFGGITTVNHLYNLPDSTYMACAGYYPSTGGSPSYIALAKFQENGNVFWRKDYHITGAQPTDGLYFNSMAVDSMFNTYLLGYISTNLYQVMGMKFDSSGNVLESKIFPDLMPDSIRSIKFENGRLICGVGQMEVYFDTTFTSVCLNEIPFNITIANNHNPSPITQNYSHTSFSLQNANPLTIPPLVFPDYCDPTSNNDPTNTNSQIAIYPNPVENIFKVNTFMNEELTLTISDLEGRIYSEKKIVGRADIDVSELSSGLYIVNLRGSTLNFSKKLIVK